MRMRGWVTVVLIGVVIFGGLASGDADKKKVKKDWLATCSETKECLTGMICRVGLVFKECGCRDEHQIVPASNGTGIKVVVRKCKNSTRIDDCSEKEKKEKFCQCKMGFRKAFGRCDFDFPLRPTFQTKKTDFSALPAYDREYEGTLARRPYYVSKTGPTPNNVSEIRIEQQKFSCNYRCRLSLRLLVIVLVLGLMALVFYECAKKRYHD